MSVPMRATIKYVSPNRQYFITSYRTASQEPPERQDTCCISNLSTLNTCLGGGDVRVRHRRHCTGQQIVFSGCAALLRGVVSEERSERAGRREMAEKFSREVTRQAVARAALALDFKEAEDEVLDTLADVVACYIETIGEVTQDAAECSGRAYPGIQDVIGCLENKKSSTKTNWRELNMFAFGKSDQPSSTSSSSVWSQPFPYPVASFPCHPPKSSSHTHQAPFSKKISSLEQPLPSFLPPHFPPFPPAHTYKKSTLDGSTASGKKRGSEVVADEAYQRSKRLQVAKNMQKSITALEEIVERSKDSVMDARGSSSTQDKESEPLQDSNNTLS